MNEETRPCVAFITSQMFSERRAYEVYDFDRDKNVTFSGDVSYARVSVFDYDRNCYVNGSGGDGRLQLFDYGSDQFLRITFRGTKFIGYDQASGSYFSGEVTPDGVALHDHQTDKSYRFRIR